MHTISCSIKQVLQQEQMHFEMELQFLPRCNLPRALRELHLAGRRVPSHRLKIGSDERGQPHNARRAEVIRAEWCLLLV
jgi:hypothetical protein